MTPSVVGLDLSLTSTGLARATGDTERILCGDLRGCARLSWIAEHIFGDGTTQAADLVVVEGPSYGSMAGGGHHESAGLWWHIVHRLDLLEVPYAIVPPSTLKKYATGSGGADKTAMAIAALKRGDREFVNDKGGDQCDAWWLRAAGLDALGHPLFDLPKAQREALDKVAWHEGVSG